MRLSRIRKSIRSILDPLRTRSKPARFSDAVVENVVLYTIWSPPAMLGLSATSLRDDSMEEVDLNSTMFDLEVIAALMLNDSRRI